jgi:small-conductance mechanosensitive channel
VWIADISLRLRVTSELNQEIDRRFREAGVEIPFPQRDLHLRSIDPAVLVRASPSPQEGEVEETRE